MLPNLIYKDVGQIPYQLSRELGWDCELVSWARTDMDVIRPDDYGRWVRWRSLGVFSSRFMRGTAFLVYLARCARRVDVLLLYHLTSESLLYCWLFKVLNPRGVAVLKLDMDERALGAFDVRASWKQRALVRLFVGMPFDVVTVETERMAAMLRSRAARLGIEPVVFPIGIEGPPTDIDAVLKNKQPIVLVAGRLGVEQKDNGLLLDAICGLEVADLGAWSFWFVGPRTPEFEVRLKRLRETHPEIAARVVLRDFVASRDALNEVYRRARVYCLTSRWESFAIVLAEAAYQGCYLLSTDVGAASDLTDGGKHGTLVPVGDVEALRAALRKVMRAEVSTEPAARAVHERVKAGFLWPDVVRGFADVVNACRRTVP